MTADTTFKEFVEENHLNFSLLDFDSLEYRDLVKAFNEVKFKLEAEEEAREREEERVRLKLKKPSVPGAPGGPSASRQRGRAFLAESSP